MAESVMVLMTVAIPGPKPSLARAAKAIGVSKEAIDKAFGIVPVDPDKHLYAVQVRLSDAPSRRSDESPYRGPFANPQIAPFGPVR